MRLSQVLFFLGLSSTICIAISDRANAQSIVSDGTLNTIIATPNDRDYTITGGRVAGNNLFHSFREFSVPTGGSATFDLVNQASVSTIFSRVTGGTVSTIDGLIKTANRHGAVSLFLLNPNGILFGKEAHLELSGSFVGTTAEHLKFADGSEFSAIAPTPLLTVSVPIGLQMGRHSRAIQVQGEGYPLLTPDYYERVTRPAMPFGLAMLPGQTIALVGSEVVFEGGMVSAPEGRIEVGSVRSGRVQLLPSFALDYGLVQQFGPLHMGNQSILDVSGNGNGSIQVQGSKVNLQEGSVLFSQNLGDRPMGDLALRASDGLTLDGMSFDETIGSGVLSESIASGTGSRILIEAENLTMDQGAQLFARNFGDGRGGDIRLRVKDTVSVIGLSPIQRITTNIVTNTFGDGRTGDLDFTVKRLLGERGGYVGSATFATGRAGDIVIHADEIEFSGIDPVLKSTSGMGTITVNRGDAGEMTLNTRQLRIFDGAIVDNSTYAFGAGGHLTVNASESVLVSGRLPGVVLPSSLSAAAPVVNQELQEFFKIPPAPTGKAGSVTVNTNHLTVTNGGTVSVRNEGVNDSGLLKINARSIEVTRGGSISATTAVGEGGNIELTVKNSLLLQRDGTISATAGGSGNGGNLTIDAGVIVAIGNSDLIANAVQGRGGNIKLTTQGLMGAQFSTLTNPRDVLTNDITASSAFNLNGTVAIAGINLTSHNALTQQPSNFVSADQLVAGSCMARRNASQGRFVVTGNGGLPNHPYEAQPFSYELNAVQPVATVPAQLKAGAIEPSRSAIVEATRLIQTSEGRLVLTADASVNSLDLVCP